MTIEELVRMPEPWHNVTHHKVDVFTRSQLRDYGEAVAAAVAKRCAEICCETDLFVTEWSTGRKCADAIRREFGEVSNG